jgi:hypothetical protein
VGARSARLLTIGLMLAAVGLASACSAQPAESAQPAVSVPAAVTAPSAPSTLAALSASVGVPAAATSVADIDGKAVNCGKVGPTRGKQVDLIADATVAGTVGCTEAIDVITQYYHDAAVPVPGDGTSHIRSIGKWACAVDTGGSVSSRQIGCGSNDGFAMHTQP